MLKLKGKPRWEASKFIFWGLVWVTIAVGGWLRFSGGYIEEFQLVRSGVSTPVYVGECFDEVVESESQGSGILTTCGYWFEANGKTYTGGPETIFDDDTVIYLPGDPTINRIKHAMGHGYWDFFLRRVGLGLLLLILFTAPGVMLFKSGIIAFIRNEEVQVN